LLEKQSIEAMMENLKAENANLSATLQTQEQCMCHRASMPNQLSLNAMSVPPLGFIPSSVYKDRIDSQELTVSSLKAELELLEQRVTDRVRFMLCSC